MLSFPLTARRAFIPLSVFAALLVAGCTRTEYRRAADRAAYCLVESRQIDPLWDIPARSVEPRPNSRMYVGPNPDSSPKPQDDSAANRWMNFPDGIDNRHYYGKIPTRTGTENPAWIDALPRDEEGQIELTQSLALDLALLNSRDYQTQYESVYLSALSLTGNRFEFDSQWFGGIGTTFTATGEDVGDQRLLNVSDRLGFSRNLAGGGQFATSILNSLFWDFGSGQVQGGVGSLVTTFTQPILRGAFRYVRLENLTQAERNLLYSVRDFARFRRIFYFSVTSDYLNLLTQVQAIRNLRTNVENLQNSLAEYQQYSELGNVSQVEVDQVYQNYQSGRLRLISAEQNLTESMDRFKFQLGVPPWVPFKIDESPLDPFELVDPRLLEMQAQTQTLKESLVQYLPPEIAPPGVLREGFAQYVQLRERLAEVLSDLERELRDWQARLDAADDQELSQDDRLDVQQQRTLAGRIEVGLAELVEDFERRKVQEAELGTMIESYTSAAELPPPGSLTLPQAGDRENDARIQAWRALLDAVGDELRRELAEVYVAQTQVRLFSIDIEPLEIDQKTAIIFAHRNRLDLMNRQAQVMDAFRRVEVAADALQSDLDVRGDMTLGSDPSKNNAFRLDSSANSYRLGVQFDGPLNRLNERNVYRARQVEYQQASRDFVAGRDTVANEVRSVLRQLKLRRLNFQIARLQIVAATRQVDQAQIAVRTGAGDAGDANLTLFLLQALQGLLDAKNNLIANWIGYRIERTRLFTALELLYLDNAGQWINAEDGLEALANYAELESEYFPPGWTPPDQNLPNMEEFEIESLSPPEANDGPTAAAYNKESTGHPDDAESMGLVVPSVPYSFSFGQ